MASTDSNSTPNRLLTSKEAAERLGLKDQTLREWRVRGYGPEFVRISRTRVRYRPDSLESFERAQSFRSTAEADEARKRATAGRG